LSPHLQIYRWPVTMLTSIVHRMTGIANAAGLVLVTLFLVATAMGRDTFSVAHSLLAAWYGRLILFAFTLTLSYHLLNGIRHLAWDTGAGFGLKTARALSLLILVGTLFLTLIIWVAAYWFAGAL
jgi:succinate dehydrogenase / fumarate reductase cytochrome b subunit